MQMPSYVSVRSRSGSRDGVALILVLACIVLLSILILSMISFTRLGRLSTASYSRSIQAQEIAQGGIQDILGDLHTEIVAGSVTPAATYINGSGSFARAYIPTNNFAAAPAHIGYDPTAWAEDINNGGSLPNIDTLSPTLLRVSRASQDSTITHFYPNISTNSYFDPTLIQNLINRASASNTSTPSANGRSVSYARWNKTFLIGCSSTTNEGDTPYCMPGAFCFTNYPAAYAAQGMVNPAIKAPYGPPDWVYVTRSGSRVCTNTATELPLLKPNSSVTTSYTVTPGQNPPASPIIGRYAYVVYDEGATLDVNAAGYYSSPQAYSMTNTANFYGVNTAPYSTMNMTNSVTGKSYLPSADLSITSLLQSQGNVNNFITWRNGSISSISNSKFQTAAFNYSLANFLSYSTGDSPLLSRQDLINYFASVDSTFNTDNNGSPGQSRALPYLGTFSRAVSAPSWTPQFNASAFGGNNGGTPGIYSYHDNAEISTATPFTSAKDNTNLTAKPGPNPNRDLANVRFNPTTSPASITHYTDAGTTGTYTAVTGDPLLQNRFSLAKIAWLSQANPVSGAGPTNTTAIQSCFGLTWGVVGPFANGGNACWSYVGSPAGPNGTLAAFNGTIETLDQVAQEGREPNFFELLKAAILNGSLGLSAGPAAFQNGAVSASLVGVFDYHTYGSYLASVTSPTTTNPAGPEGAYAGSDDLYAYTYDGHVQGGPAGVVPAASRISDIQIMQIGANIIDQFDADSYPTAIYFKYQGITNTYDAATSAEGEFGKMDMVYGDENLPDLSEMDVVSSTADGLPIGPASPNKPSFPSAGDPFNVPPASPTVKGFSDWWQPVLWNFHQMPNQALPSAVSPPTSYAVKGYGQIQFSWQTNQILTYKTDTNLPYAQSGDPHGGFQIPATIQGVTGTTTPETMESGSIPQVISFTESNPTDSVFYANPLLLTVDQNKNANDTVSASTSDSVDMQYNTSMYDYATNHFVGFWGGDDTSYFGTDWNFVNVEAVTSGPATYVLGWTSGGSFHPYSFIPGVFGHAYGVVNNGPTHEQPGTVPPTSPPNPQGDADPAPVSAEAHLLIDPRTDRFGTVALWQVPDNETSWMNNNPTYCKGGDTYGNGQPAASQFKYFWPNQYGFFIVDWEANTPTPLAQTGATSTYYNDLDGVVRPGDGVFGNYTTGDGMLDYMAAPKPGYPGVGAGTDGTAIGDTVATSTQSYFATYDKGASAHARRPVILNRPFRNVGELGYTFRDEPFKTLDFFSQYSADAALLDVFSTTDESQVTSANTLNSVVAGKVDINNAPVPVLNALLNYGSKKDFDPSYDMLKSGANSDSSTVATAIANQLAIPAWNSGTGTGPMASRADLVTLLGANPGTGVGAIRNNLQKAWDKENKAYLEAPVRALSNVANARTWNLMIDIIAQSGELTPTATSLDNFVVQGEKRYWLHIAIDRYTGKIVDQQLEQVYE
jgi:hypothetical protein